jgi:hypothetical protein
MKHSVLLVFLTGMILVLFLAVPGTAATISTISPDTAYTNGKIITVTITGTNFSATEGYVKLEMPGKTAIEDYSITSWEAEEIICRFRFPSTTATGDWDLVVVNADTTRVVKPDGFTLMNSLTLTSISPASGQIDDNDVDFTLAGTGLSEVTGVYLDNAHDDNIDATGVDAVSATTVRGTFDLTGASEDTYDVCVMDSFGTEECDLSFKVTTDAVGNIDISSSPSGASIYVDGLLIGSTPDTVDDLAGGSYKVVLKKTGYNDWGKIVRVTAGDTSTVDADLEVMTSQTAVPTTLLTPVKTLAKSTLKVPTSWPSATAMSTTASPWDPAATVGVICLAFIILRKH